MGGGVFLVSPPPGITPTPTPNRAKLKITLGRRPNSAKYFSKSRYVGVHKYFLSKSPQYIDIKICKIAVSILFALYTDIPDLLYEIQDFLQISHNIPA